MNKELDRAENIKGVFELVKESVSKILGESRAGIDLGLIDLGNTDHQLLSAYHPLGSNIIVLNKTPLKRVTQTRPELMKPYVFVVLLHEYLHSLGYVDEEDTRQLTLRITNELFGNSVVTEMARDMKNFFPFLLYPGGHPPIDKMDLIELEETDYIG